MQNYFCHITWEGKYGLRTPTLVADFLSYKYVSNYSICATLEFLIPGWMICVETHAFRLNTLEKNNC